MTEKTLIPGLEGIPCAASSVSFIDGIAGILEYRGYDITTLANHGTFEEVAYLLLYGELPKKDELVAFDAELRANRVLKYPVLDIIKSLPSTGHPMKAIQAGVAVLGAFYPVDDLNNAHEQRLASVRLIAQLPTVVAAFHRARQGDEPIAPNVELNHATNFLYMLDGQIPSAVISRTLDIAMILHMEHTMNASTFTGRVVASTLADPYAVVSSPGAPAAARPRPGARARRPSAARRRGTAGSRRRRSSPRPRRRRRRPPLPRGSARLRSPSRAPCARRAGRGPAAGASPSRPAARARPGSAGETLQ